MIDPYAAYLAMAPGTPNFQGPAMKVLNGIKIRTAILVRVGIPVMDQGFTAAHEVLQASTLLTDSAEDWKTLSDAILHRSSENLFGSQSKKDRDAGYKWVRPEGSMPYFPILNRSLYDIVGHIHVTAKVGSTSPREDSSDWIPRLEGAPGYKRDSDRAGGRGDRDRDGGRVPKPEARKSKGDGYGGALFANLNKAVDSRALKWGVCIGHLAMGVKQTNEHYLAECDLHKKGKVAEWATAHNSFVPPTGK